MSIVDDYRNNRFHDTSGFLPNPFDPSDTLQYLIHMGKVYLRKTDGVRINSYSPCYGGYQQRCRTASRETGMIQFVVGSCALDEIVSTQNKPAWVEPFVFNYFTPASYSRNQKFKMHYFLNRDIHKLANGACAQYFLFRKWADEQNASIGNKINLRTACSSRIERAFIEKHSSTKRKLEDYIDDYSWAVDEEDYDDSAEEIIEYARGVANDLLNDGYWEPNNVTQQDLVDSTLVDLIDLYIKTVAYVLANENCRPESCGFWIVPLMWAKDMAEKGCTLDIEEPEVREEPSLTLPSRDSGSDFWSYISASNPMDLMRSSPTEPTQEDSMISNLFE